MKTTARTTATALALLLSASAWAQNAAPPTLAQEDPAHQELRALREGLVDALKKVDIERILPFLHRNFVITWQNAEISRGHEAVRAYYNRMMHGPHKVLDSYDLELSVDDLTILYGGDTGVSYGGSVEHYKLSNGPEFTLKGRWSATLVKENGKWLLASVHTSTNLFDNPLLQIAKKASYLVGGISLLIGVVVGWLIRRKRKSAAPDKSA
ncbi:MAG: nuclear transport factor 2 family protein [Verrucomicrobia bacterium]|nr:nuclear transport factor 2 family protein [Verrucomicrobiota bacterium]